jgi:hypothetical protein
MFAIRKLMDLRRQPEQPFAGAASSDMGRFEGSFKPGTKPEAIARLNSLVSPVVFGDDRLGVIPASPQAMLECFAHLKVLAIDGSQVTLEVTKAEPLGWRCGIMIGGETAFQTGWLHDGRQPDGSDAYHSRLAVEMWLDQHWDQYQKLARPSFRVISDSVVKMSGAPAGSPPHQAVVKKWLDPICRSENLVEIEDWDDRHFRALFKENDKEVSLLFSNDQSGDGMCGPKLKDALRYTKYANLADIAARGASDALWNNMARTIGPTLGLVGDDEQPPGLRLTNHLITRQEGEREALAGKLRLPCVQCHERLDFSDPRRVWSFADLYLPSIEFPLKRALDANMPAQLPVERVDAAWDRTAVEMGFRDGAELSQHLGNLPGQEREAVARLLGGRWFGQENLAARFLPAPASAEIRYEEGVTRTGIQ